MRNIIEQVNEWQATLYFNFIDFEKAFDSVHRESMWQIMSKIWSPRENRKIFYEGLVCAIEVQGKICSWFGIKTGVKKGAISQVFYF